MGRFGIRNYADRWGEPLPGVKPLVEKDTHRTVAVLAALFATACVPAGVPYFGTSAAILLPASVVVLARVPFSHLRPRLLAMLPFGLLTVLFLPWDTNGLALSLSIMSKLLAAALWLSYLSATTPVARLMTALRSLRMPGTLVDILESTIRYLGLLAGEAKQMMLSCRLRGTSVDWRVLDPRRLSRAFSRFASLVAGLFLRTLERSERCIAARASRETGKKGGPESLIPTDSVDEILVEGLTHRYPGAEANSLTGVSLNVPRGRRIAILGANGAGKSTLLLHCNGVLAVQSGRVSIGGLEVVRKHLATIRSRVGMVFQNPDDQVFAPTVLQDVRFGPEQIGLSEDECVNRAKAALRLVGLWNQAHRAPFSLSQGQRKRAAIAGVIAAGAETLLFDEPMASLDPAGKDEIQVVLKDLHAEGKTLVVATHDVDFAAGWADGVVLMEGGRVVAVGGPGLLVDEAAMSVAGLALPLVSRPFDLLRPHLEQNGVDLERLPANTEEAFAWLKFHFVDRWRQPEGKEYPTPVTVIEHDEGSGS